MKKLRFALAAIAFVFAAGAAIATSSSLPDEAKLWDGSGYNIVSTPQDVMDACPGDVDECGYIRENDHTDFYGNEE